MYSEQIGCVLDYDIKYYKCDKISILPAWGGMDVFISYCANNSLFIIDNPELKGHGELPDIVVVLNVVCYIGSTTIPHMECTLSDSSSDMTMEEEVKSYFICDARDVLDDVLRKMEDDIYDTLIL